MTETHEFIVSGWDGLLDLGDGLALLHYPPEEDQPAGHAYAMKHPCQRADDLVLIVAPRLDLHTIGEGSIQGGDITIGPSILCPDCGLHGYIHAGRWEPA